MNINSIDFSQARLNMVQSQALTNKVKTDMLKQALSVVPREDFLPTHLVHLAYSDLPVQVGNRSALPPFILARCLEALDLDLATSLLYVGSHGGYGPALASFYDIDICGIEEDSHLFDLSQQRLQNFSHIKLVHSNFNLNSELGTFDTIMVEGAVSNLESLNLHAVMHGMSRALVIVRPNPLGSGRAIMVYKTPQAVHQQDLFDISCDYLTPDFRPQSSFIF